MPPEGGGDLFKSPAAGPRATEAVGEIQLCQLRNAPRYLDAGPPLHVSLHIAHMLVREQKTRGAWGKWGGGSSQMARWPPQGSSCGFDIARS